MVMANSKMRVVSYWLIKVLGIATNNHKNCWELVDKIDRNYWGIAGNSHKNDRN